MTTFLLGPVGAIFLVPAAVVTLVLSGRPRADLLPATALAAGTGLAWVAHWILWSVGLSHLNTYRPSPPWVTTGVDVAAFLSAYGAVLLVLVTIGSLAFRNRSAQDW